MNVESLKELRGRAALVVLDTNAFIHHLDEGPDFAGLQADGTTEEQAGEILQRWREPLKSFYLAWLDELDDERLVITDACLDLELSAWRYRGDRPDHFRRRFPRGTRLPRGDLVRTGDPRRVRAAKNRVLDRLHTHHRLNPRLKRAAKGLRGALAEALRSRKIWSSALERSGLSAVDIDLLVQSLAAGTLGPAALVTRDRSLGRLALELTRYLTTRGLDGDPRLEPLRSLQLEWRVPIIDDDRPAITEPRLG